MKKWLLLFCLVSTLHAADDKRWTWKDRAGVVRSRPELDSILQEHRKWADTKGKEGKQADLGGASLTSADLISAYFPKADLTKANLNGANLSRAYLWRADLSGARLIQADLDEANVAGTNLKGAVYAPKHHPPMPLIAQAYGLGYLTWRTDPEPIYALRKSLSDAGFIGPSRQVNAAIHRNNQSRLERFLFDWTCEWGANWLRPLAIAAVLSLLCTLIYWIGMHFHTRSGLYLSATGERIATAKGRERVVRIAVRPSRTAPATDQLEFELEPKPQVKGSRAKSKQRLGWEMKALSTAFLFSLMSVFNIGFREFNFGRWIRMLQPREFDIRARGWMRTVSGIQSLIGVALLALSLLSYFGHPFD
jgi:Pentapeptide repeats (8 copies)